MIKFEKVSKIYSGHGKGHAPTAALDGINFEVKEGEFVILVGRSGAGKTTILRLLLAEEKPTAGKIFFDGQEINKMRPESVPMLRRQIGSVFQDYKLLSQKTAYENVAYVLEVIGAGDEEIARDVPKILELVGLQDKMNNFPDELSAGEKQRLAIARALIHRPSVILADEPTGNLDPYNTLDIVNILNKINQMGTTLVLATHDKELVNALRKRVVTLEKGKIIKDAENGSFII